VKNIAVHWVVLLFFDEFRRGQDANQSSGGTMQKYGVSVTSDGQKETIEVCLKFKLLIKKLQFIYN